MHQKYTYHHIDSCWVTVGLLLLLVILVGCTVSREDIPSNETTNFVTTVTPPTIVTAILSSKTPAPSVTPTVSTTETPLPSVIPTAIATVTSLPSKIPTATSTSAPTLTPLPTIPPQQRGQYYTELMKNNGNCEMPCWWGFELGETSIDKVRQFYTTFDAFITEQKGRNARSALYVTFVDPQIEDGIQVRHTFVAQDEVVIEAEVEVVYEPNYQIKPLLQRLGQPSEVWMWTIPDTFEGVLPAAFLLFFPERGVMVSYAVFAERVDDVVQVCFDNGGGTILLLWEPTIWNADNNKGFVERANESSELTLQGDQPINEVSNWDVEQFYTVLTDPTQSECLETPSDLWPSP